MMDGYRRCGISESFRQSFIKVKLFSCGKNSNYRRWQLGDYYHAKILVSNIIISDGICVVTIV